MRADLHVHSKHSDRPSEWLLRRIGAPESFTEPIEVYERCRPRGMDFVTISDHNCIDGALEVAHLPGTFISNEVTTYFPDDGCKIHCLVLGISETQFEAIQEVRKDIYAFRDYVLAENIVYSVAHPLYSVNDRLTPAHFEKLLVLFKRFEGINGARDPRACMLARAVFDRLSREDIEVLANKHDLEPREPEPWKKVLTGGSDDHGGLYVASAFTKTPPARDVNEFLGHLRRFDHQCGGSHGSSLELARSFYAIGYRFYRDRLLSRSARGPDMLDELFSRLLGDETPTAATFSLKQSVRYAFKPKKAVGGFDRMIVQELIAIARQETTNAPLDETAARRSFRKASRLSHQLTNSAVSTALNHLENGRLVECLQTVSSLAPLALCIAPYLAAFHTQHKDRPLLDRVDREWRIGSRPRTSIAWFTDTYNESNGVARIIETFADSATARGDSVSVFTCQDEAPAAPFLRNFPPTHSFEVAEYRGQVMNFPPLLDVAHECERLGVTEVVISTPGPVGAAGLAIARMLNLRATGIYHTDFPAYVQAFTGSPSLEQLTWQFMRWFFDQMDSLFVPSQIYIDDLAARGFKAERMQLMPRGVNLEQFGARFRQPDFWSRRGMGDGLKVLFVGRISKEKNLDLTLEAFNAVRAAGEDVDMVLVGDGPYREELENRHGCAHVHFTGTLQGRELAAAYASSDLFVFASRTDTFGNVVLEAQACGLPVIVSDRCGAKEIVASEGWGLIVDTATAIPMAEAMVRLVRDPELRTEFSSRALATVTERSHRRWAATFWEMIVDSDATRGESPAPTSSAPLAWDPTTTRAAS